MQRINLKTQLRHYLEAHEMTSAQLARKSGIGKSVLSDWLAGSKPRDLEQVKRVASVLGTSVDHLCFGDGVEQRPTGPKEAADPFADLAGEGWFGGLFEIRVRRVKRGEP